jgi:hypothetical protein
MAELCAESEEFAALWKSHDVAVRHTDLKRIVHPEQGIIEAYCHNMPTEDGRQRLLWLSPRPGAESARQLGALAAERGRGMLDVP